MESVSKRLSMLEAWDSKAVSLMSPELSERMQSDTVPDHLEVLICFTLDFLLTRTWRQRFSIEKHASPRGAEYWIGGCHVTENMKGGRENDRSLKGKGRKRTGNEELMFKGQNN